MNRRLQLALIGLICAVGAAAARVHVDPKLQASSVTIGKVVLLPPEIEFMHVGVKGPESNSTESDQLAGSLYSVLASELTARGVTVLPDPMAAAATDEAKYAIAKLQSEYDSLRIQLNRKPKRVDDGHITLGDGVATFEPARGADALVLVRGTATQATKAKTAAILIGFGALSGFEGDIGFVDARTGDVLAWTRINRRRDVSNDPNDRLLHCTREALRDVPLPVPAAR
jgi:hypothetical protein